MSAQVKKGYMERRSRREKIGNAVVFVILVLLSAVALFPIWWIFRSSLMSNTEMYAFPPPLVPPVWRFSNYADALVTFDFWLYFRNSMLIIVPSVIGGTLTATLSRGCISRAKSCSSPFASGRCCCLPW